jgi:putative addiction module killer protein
MQYSEVELEFYESMNGRQIVKEWLELLDNKIRARVMARLNRLRSGNFGDLKRIGEGIEELRFDFGPGYRIYIGRVGKKLVILLNGGDKSTQQKDIKKAYEYWVDYRRRYV